MSDDEKRIQFLSDETQAVLHEIATAEITGTPLQFPLDAKVGAPYNAHVRFLSSIGAVAVASDGVALLTDRGRFRLGGMLDCGWDLVTDTRILAAHRLGAGERQMLRPDEAGGLFARNMFKLF